VQKGTRCQATGPLALHPRTHNPEILVGRFNDGSWVGTRSSRSSKSQNISKRQVQ
jgi:hypothetical protein